MQRSEIVPWRAVGKRSAKAGEATTKLHGQLTIHRALGNAAGLECLAGDGNQDGAITVEEILTAVNNALNGCGG
jgi:hypothetical protein